MSKLTELYRKLTESRERLMEQEEEDYQREYAEVLIAFEEFRRKVMLLRYHTENEEIRYHLRHDTEHLLDSDIERSLMEIFGKVTGEHEFNYDKFIAKYK